MKRIITILVIFVFLASFTSIFAYANTQDEGAEICSVSQPSSSPLARNTARVERLYIQTFPEKTVYKAFELIDMSGLSVRAIYDDGSERAVPLDELQVSYQQDERFRVGDDGVSLSFGGKSVNVPVTVERIPYDISDLTLNNFTVEYNGKLRSYTDPLPSIVGLDGIPLEIKVVGGGTNVGVYSITIDFYTESNDYLTPESKIVTMTVSPLETDIIWSDLSFVYDGKSKIPTAYYTDVKGAKIYVAVSGAATESGSYSARVTASDPNYSFKNTSMGYEIKKADYDFSSVVWSKSQFVYDGTQKRVYLSGLPDGVSIIAYNSDRARSAGSYTVSATLSWDDRNYNAPASLSHTWEILPAEYDMSGVKFLSCEAVYDGITHYPTIDGAMPTGADGIRLEYSFSGGALHVSDGEVLVRVSFSTKSKNYISPKDVYVSVKITPKPIKVAWSDLKLSYNGELQAPTATASECKIIVSGGGVNVGLYKAVAVAENDDFTVENKDYEFEIVKSFNFWVSEPSAKTSYEGSSPNIIAEAKFGLVEYRYFSDPECKNEIAVPSSCGRYYAIAFVADSENYFGISSSKIAFDVIEVLPVGLGIEITKSKLQAFDLLLYSDFRAYILHNDGSTSTVDSSAVAIIYQNGNALGLKDDKITFSYKGFTTEVDISVSKADYDLSGIFWENSSVTYDGTPKSPTLKGLPMGVRAIEYIGAGVTDAGVYTVSVILEYDAENYNEPLILPCEFTVKKCVLPIPLISSIYNGMSQTPIVDSELYTISFDGVFLDAGEYSVRATLTDSKNYKFEGVDSAECVAKFKIEPRAVYIAVPDVTVHLWDKLSAGSYTVTSGGAIGEDKLVLSSYVDGATLKYRSENPNYRVVQTGGEIHRLPYPSAMGTLKLVIWLFVIAGIIALTVFCIRSRHIIANAFAIVRCRWNNRRITINPPRKIIPTTVQNRFKSSAVLSKSEDDNSKSEIADEPSSELSHKEEEKEADENAQVDESFEESESDDEESEEQIEESEELLVVTESLSVDVERADELISDSLAKNLVRKGGEVVYTDGSSKSIINVDTLSENFHPGDRIDVNTLKKKSLIPYDTAYIKVLARGIIDKPLSVCANDFSLSAVKMIALTGGEAIKTVTLKPKDKNKQDT